MFELYESEQLEIDDAALAAADPEMLDTFKSARPKRTVTNRLRDAEVPVVPTQPDHAPTVTPGPVTVDAGAQGI